MAGTQLVVNTPTWPARPSRLPLDWLSPPPQRSYPIRPMRVQGMRGMGAYVPSQGQQFQATGWVIFGAIAGALVGGLGIPVYKMRDARRNAMIGAAVGAGVGWIIG